MEIKLKGIPAIVVIVAIAGFVVWQNQHIQNDPAINEKLQENVEFQLFSELAGGIEQDSKAIQAALKEGDRALAKAKSQNVLQRKVK